MNNFTWEDWHWVKKLLNILNSLYPITICCLLTSTCFIVIMCVCTVISSLQSWFISCFHVVHVALWKIQHFYWEIWMFSKPYIKNNLAVTTTQVFWLQGEWLSTLQVPASVGNEWVMDCHHKGTFLRVEVGTTHYAGATGVNWAGPGACEIQWPWLWMKTE